MANPDLTPLLAAVPDSSEAKLPKRGVERTIGVSEMRRA